MEERKATLEQALVDEYCHKATQKRQADKYLKKERGGIIEAMQAGTICPTGGPGLIELSSRDVAELSWKEMAIEYLMGRDGLTRIQAEQRAEARFEKVPRKPEPYLSTTLNPDYERNNP